MIKLDHIAVSGCTLEEARAHVEEALRVKLQPGGAHDVFFTHNALLGLEDGLYLEAIAINPDAPKPARPRWFDLDRFAGAPCLTNWICRTSALDAVLAQLPEGFGKPVNLQRGDLRWAMAVPATGILPFDNCAPALIQWHTDKHPAERLPASSVRLRRLSVQHPDADALSLKLGGLLNDDRIAFEKGDACLMAEFDTPHGSRMLC